MTDFRLDVSRQTGMATLWMTADTPCGFIPVLEWPHMDGVREFAEMLLNIYYTSQTNREGHGGVIEMEEEKYFLN